MLIESDGCIIGNNYQQNAERPTNFTTLSVSGIDTGPNQNKESYQFFPNGSHCTKTLNLNSDSSKPYNFKIPLPIKPSLPQKLYNTIFHKDEPYRINEIDPGECPPVPNRKNGIVTSFLNGDSISATTTDNNVNLGNIQNSDHHYFNVKVSPQNYYVTATPTPVNSIQSQTTATNTTRRWLDVQRHWVQKIRDGTCNGSIKGTFEGCVSPIPTKMKCDEIGLGQNGTETKRCHQQYNNTRDTRFIYHNSRSVPDLERCHHCGNNTTSTSSTTKPPNGHTNLESHTKKGHLHKTGPISKEVTIIDNDSVGNPKNSGIMGGCVPMPGSGFSPKLNLRNKFSRLSLKERGSGGAATRSAIMGSAGKKNLSCVITRPSVYDKSGLDTFAKPYLNPFTDVLQPSTTTSTNTNYTQYFLSRKIPFRRKNRRSSSADNVNSSAEVESSYLVPNPVPLGNISHRKPLVQPNFTGISLKNYGLVAESLVIPTSTTVPLARRASVSVPLTSTAHHSPRNYFSYLDVSSIVASVLIRRTPKRRTNAGHFCSTPLHSDGHEADNWLSNYLNQYSSPYDNIFGACRPRNIRTGASAALAATASNLKAASSSHETSSSTPPTTDTDFGDGRGNELVENCAYFRAEIGDELIRHPQLDATYTSPDIDDDGYGIANLSSQFADRSDNRHQDLSDLGKERLPFSHISSHSGTILRSPKCAGLTLLDYGRHYPLLIDPVLRWDEGVLAGDCSSDITVIENSDDVAHFYRIYFLGQDHVNFFGIEPTYGPIAISMSRKIDRNTDSNVNYYYNIIIRTSQLTSIKGSVAEEIIPSNSKHGIISKGLPPRDIIGYVLPEINLNCLRLSDTSSKVEQKLLSFDEQQIKKNYKVGILYCKPGQSTEEEMYNNEISGPSFTDFLRLLGEIILLKGFDKYKAELDTKSDTTGLNSVYTTFLGYQLMFHISTMLPFTPNNKQQILRKRHIGNDVVTIIFQEPGSLPFSPKNVRSHYQHVFVIVRAVGGDLGTTHKNLKYKVAISRSKDVEPFGPPLPHDGLFENSQDLRKFLLTKCINAENAAQKSEKFATMAIRARYECLKDLATNHVTQTCLEPANSSGSILSKISLGGSKKREKTAPITICNPTGAMYWPVQVFDYGMNRLTNDCHVALSADIICLIEMGNTHPYGLSGKVIFVTSTCSVIGWKVSENGLRIYYNEGECIQFYGKEYYTDITDICDRLRQITNGSRVIEYTFSKPHIGCQLGFFIEKGGYITDIEKGGLAWEAGLLPGTRIVEVCNVAVVTMELSKIYELLKKSSHITLLALSSVNGSAIRCCERTDCPNVSLHSSTLPTQSDSRPLNLNSEDNDIFDAGTKKKISNHNFTSHSSPLQKSSNFQTMSYSSKRERVNEGRIVKFLPQNCNLDLPKNSQYLIPRSPLSQRIAETISSSSNNPLNHLKLHTPVTVTQESNIYTFLPISSDLSATKNIDVGYSKIINDAKLRSTMVDKQTVTQSTSIAFPFITSSSFIDLKNSSLPSYMSCHKFRNSLDSCLPLSHPIQKVSQIIPPKFSVNYHIDKYLLTEDGHESTVANSIEDDSHAPPMPHRRHNSLLNDTDKLVAKKLTKPKLSPDTYHTYPAQFNNFEYLIGSAATSHTSPTVPSPHQRHNSLLYDPDRRNSLNSNLQLDTSLTHLVDSSVDLEHHLRKLITFDDDDKVDISDHGSVSRGSSQSRDCSNITAQTSENDEWNTLVEVTSKTLKMCQKENFNNRDLVSSWCLSVPNKSSFLHIKGLSTTSSSNYKGDGSCLSPFVERLRMQYRQLEVKCNEESRDKVILQTQLEALKLENEKLKQELSVWRTKWRKSPTSFSHT